MALSIDEIKRYLGEFAKEADQVLDRFFDEEKNRSGTIDPVVEEFLFRYRRLLRGGKKIRGGLTVLGHEIFGGDKGVDIVKVGCFIEMTHASLLIHDDIHDRDELRRGLPTLHKQFEAYFAERGFRGDDRHYGIAMGDTIGLLGSFLRFPLLLQTDFPPERLLKAIGSMSYFLVNTDYGQAMDITYEHLNEVSEEEVMRVHRYKTADYTVTMPLTTGAILAGASESAFGAIRNYGTPVGIAFQIRDDIIGMYGEEKVIGKPVGSDIREGKNTLLFTEARKRADREQRAVLEKWYGNKDLTSAGVEAVREVVRATGSLAYSEKLGWKYVEEGKKFIGEISADPRHQEMLAVIADFMMAREK
jgi:geranylgeranyl diphosphate synthase type I